MVHARLYIGISRGLPGGISPPGDYVSCLTSQGLIRRKIQYGDDLEELVRKAVRAAASSIHSIQLLIHERPTKYATLRSQGYKRLSDDELLEAECALKKALKSEAKGKVKYCGIAFDTLRIPKPEARSGVNPA